MCDNAAIKRCPAQYRKKKKSCSGLLNTKSKMFLPLVGSETCCVRKQSRVRLRKLSPSFLVLVLSRFRVHFTTITLIFGNNFSLELGPRYHTLHSSLTLTQLSFQPGPGPSDQSLILTARAPWGPDSVTESDSKTDSEGEA